MQDYGKHARPEGQGSAFNGAMAAAMSRAAAKCAGLSTSKVSVVAVINSPPFGKCSDSTVDGGVIFSRKPGAEILNPGGRKIRGAFV